MPKLNLINLIDAVLPQTQCTKCGYQGCLPYATAIANGNAPINRCPPGGELGIAKLAQLLHTSALPLDPECGAHEPLLVAVIDEEHCIGCTLCIQACPVDAIVGANKLMHTVLPDLCTGCDLCVAPCPVDCIEMIPANRTWNDDDANMARAAYQRRQARLESQHNEESNLVARTLSNKAELSDAAFSDAETRQDTIQNALARARARRLQNKQ